MSIKKTFEINVKYLRVSVQCMIQCTLLNFKFITRQRSLTLKATLNHTKFSEYNNERVAFCLATITCPLIKPLRKRRKPSVPNLQCGPATMRSLHKSDNKYRHPNGIFGKLFSSCIHTSIHLTEIMSFLDPLIYSEQLLFTVQQYGSKWIAVLSLKKRNEK